MKGKGISTLLKGNMRIHLDGAVEVLKWCNSTIIIFSAAHIPTVFNLFTSYSNLIRMPCLVARRNVGLVYLMQQSGNEQL